MRAILLKSTQPVSLQVDDIADPELRPGQVLVRMAAAPINPSDLVFLQNRYGIEKRLPVVPGFEGAGTVVAARAGLYGDWLLGRRVACRAPVDGNGTWAELMATEAAGVVPLRSGISLEQGATLLVNPLTAWALLSDAKREGHTGFVQTAAASALGLMMVRLGRRWGLRSINVVRRTEQIAPVTAAGGTVVLDLRAADFPSALAQACESHDIRLAFDAVGGPLTETLAAAMPKGSRLLVYGALAGESCSISPRSLIFEGKSLEGFWLSERLRRTGLLRKMRMAWGVQGLLGTDLATRIQDRFPFNRVNDAIALYKAHRSEGKVLLLPSPGTPLHPTLPARGL